MRDVSSECVGGLLVAALMGCSHGQAAKPRAEGSVAEAAINETRGRCPTDLNETQVALSDKADTIRIIFITSDASQKGELLRRVSEVGNALEKVHPAVDAQGQIVQRLPTPRVELREKALNGVTPSQYGWELVINTPGGEVHRRVRADLDDEMRQWRKGECPILRDEPMVARPDSLPTTTPANARMSPGQDR
jgi:hypothetical protein